MDQEIKKIHNAVFVSDRIITYKVAAAILEVEVNEAKKVLEKYLKDQNDKNEILNVSYILGGVTHDDIHKVKLVPQIKYEKTKSLFKTINIDHLYSVQKSSLADWSCIANVDDFLYDKNDTPAQVREVKPKAEPVAVKKEVKSPPKNNKKGALSNFLNNANTNNLKKTENKVGAAQKTVDSKNKKQEKSNAFTNYFNKGNKENVKEGKKESQESDDEEIFKVNKKRTRVLNDEDDDTPSKCAKIDILDEPEEEIKEEYHSDEDLFGSPEKDEELMKDTEESTEMETENSLPEQKSETTESHTETTEENTEKSEENTEKSETMYEDDDGYFVTEKKKPGSKQNNIKPEKQMSKKEAEVKKKIEKEETKSKKEVTQKIKNNTNQKTLFSFFQKK